MGIKDHCDCPNRETCECPYLLRDLNREESQRTPGRSPREVQQIVEDKAAEITRLKEQLARTERERDQAIYVGGIEIDRGNIYAYDGKSKDTSSPELYAHLAGKVEG